MKAETLRKSILQYAMQGKLVPQDSNDEPACELLKRIKAEKEQLIKEGKIKKEKLLPPITADEIPFELPKGWEWVRLPNVTYSVGNKNNQIQTSEILKSGKYPVVSQGQNLIDGYSNYEEKSIRTLPLVMFGDHTKNVKYIDFPFVIGADGTKFHKCILVNAKFIYYWMLTTSGEIINRGYARHYSLIKEKLIPLPPLDEQERIVEKLEQILPLVEEYGNNEDKLSELNKTLPDKIKQSILQHAVQGKLVPQNPSDEPASKLLKRIKTEKEQLIKDGKIKKEKPLPPITEDEIPYELPQSWEWVRLGEIVNYGSTGSLDYSENLDKNMWILDLEDIEKVSSKLLMKNRIKGKSFNSTKKCFQKGDILYGKLRPYLDKVIVADEDGICSTEILPLRVYADMNPFYLRWVLKNPTFLQYVNQLTYGVKMPRLGTEDGKKALIPVPPLAEQQRIVEKVEDLIHIVDRLERKEV